MNFLFWNINKKDLTNEIVDLVEEHQIDVLVLIECTIESKQLLKSLQITNSTFFNSPRLVYSDKNILFLSKLDTQFVKDLGDESRYFAKQIITDNQPINVVVTHYPSKINYSEDDQRAVIPEFNDFIKEIEKLSKNDKTLVLGDFNMNPFEKAMVQHTGLHSTMDKNTALKQSRIVNKKNYKYFYNPMWSFFGELGKGSINGTYYYQGNKPVLLNWNMFDQVLIRPGLIPYFDDNDIEIITNIKEKTLLRKSGIIDKRNFSDHLPVKFTLKI